jgi:two-component SAPR family response regulator
MGNKMKAIVVDDEMRALNMLCIFLGRIEDVEIAGKFTNPHDALAFLNKTEVDIAFLDVEMPEMSGVEFAHRCICLKKVPAIVFVTGFEQYAMDAWGVEAVDYILKPYDEARVRNAVKKAGILKPPSRAKKVEIVCFPSFEVKVDSSPIPFKCKKGKELLAYLVDNEGRWVTSGQIISALWEDKPYDDNLKNTYYVTGFRLRKELEKYDIEDILEAQKCGYRVNTEKFSCDYYRYLAGENAGFRGQYLSEYSWGEETLAYLLTGGRR